MKETQEKCFNCVVFVKTKARWKAAVPARTGVIAVAGMGDLLIEPGLFGAPALVAWQVL